MTTTYPGTIQTFTDPSGTSQLASGPDHAQLHTDINDTVEAIQHTIGTTSGTAILQGITEVSTDGTMGGDSDTAIPTEKAVKAYVDGKIIDEDDMASDSATKVPTQQSVKAYVDNNLSSANTDGWTADTDTWVYVSASTFKIEGKDVTARFPKGTRLKFTQTTTKYAVVVDSAFSTDTTITIAVNTDYTIANAAISLNYYSYQANPQGYPTWFNITAPVFTITEIDNGSGGQPTVTEYRASVVGSQLTAHIKGSGTKVGAIYYFSMAISPLPTPANTTQATTMGVAHGYVGATDKFGMLVYSSNKLYYIYTANYADNDIITHFSATFQYEI